MVKLLEEDVSNELDLRQLRDKTLTSKENPAGISLGEREYACDCDQWGGGDPPCDCNSSNSEKYN